MSTYDQTIAEQRRRGRESRDRSLDLMELVRLATLAASSHNTQPWKFRLTNAFAQVLVVSAAEVIVCWAIMGASVEAWLRPRGRAVSLVGAALIASVLFGVYHFAHSPPFNALSMVVLLTVIGLVTSTFFLIARDIYATILFHNFLGLFGVTRALAESGQLHAFERLQPPLLGMAALTIAVLAISDWTLLRRRTQSENSK